jgi:hypothetical protein
MYVEQLPSVLSRVCRAANVFEMMGEASDAF